MNSISKRIKELCAKNNLSIEQLADASGVSMSTIRSIISTDREMNVRILTIDKLVRGFDISFAEFFDSEIFK